MLRVVIKGRLCQKKVNTGMGRPGPAASRARQLLVHTAAEVQSVFVHPSRLVTARVTWDLLCDVTYTRNITRKQQYACRLCVPAVDISYPTVIMTWKCGAWMRVTGAHMVTCRLHDMPPAALSCFMNCSSPTGGRQLYVHLSQYMTVPLFL